MKPIRVIIADDHALVRAGFRALLESMERVEVLAEAGDGRVVIELIRELHPDLLLLDLSMPGLNGFEVLKESSRDFPEVRVMVLTVHEEGEYAIRALREGAAGYLPKSAASTELKQAIYAVARGETYVSPEISRKTLLEFGKRSSGDWIPPDKLSPRQREILTMIAEGRTTKDMAQSLNISVKTVEAHRAQLMDRLNIHDIATLVRYAIRMGLIKAD